MSKALWSGCCRFEDFLFKIEKEVAGRKVGFHAVSCELCTTSSNTKC